MDVGGGGTEKGARHFGLAYPTHLISSHHKVFD